MHFSQAASGKYQLQQEKTQQALDKAQNDFDRLQEKFERAQNDTRRVSQPTQPSLTIFVSRLAIPHAFLVSYYFCTTFSEEKGNI